MLHENIIQGIINKIEDLNKNPAKERDNVFHIISELNDFIYSDKELTEEEIQKLIGELTFFTTLIPIPVPLGMDISRAVRYEDDGVVVPCYNEISRLSYIPESMIEEKAKLGRMNQLKEPMFYGCLYTNPNSIGTALSEVNAQKNENFNVLFSKTKSTLQLIPIGVFDNYRRGIEHLWKLHGSFKDIYDLYKLHTHPSAMIALHLCDAFLYKVLKEKSTEKLYRVTSQIAKECLSAPIIDGLIYASVQFDNHPNIVIKPKSIDAKVAHKEVISLEVIENYGYGIYQTKNTHHAYINDNKIDWKEIK
ncbi:MAG: hypothetical protein Q7S59_04765 [Sulfurimonas sp.]|nr:hypothetical protein [Sulfurimonas sp.]